MIDQLFVVSCVNFLEYTRCTTYLIDVCERMLNVKARRFHESSHN